MKRKLVLTMALAFLVAFSALLFAQQKTATLKGTVKDNEGRVVTGVTVTATNTNTGIAWSDTSDDRGRFILLTLTPGTYDVKLAKCAI